MEVEKEIDIKQNCFDELENHFDYYSENYSMRFAESFRAEFFAIVFSIPIFHLKYPECRYLPTKNKIYRCLAWGDFVIIYKIKPKTIDVLSLFHAHQNPNKLKSLRRIK